MRKTMMAAGMVAVVLTGCSKSGPPPKREPGSWSQKIEIKRLEGKDADKAKVPLGQMFAMMSSMSVCVTPDMAAKEDPTANLGKIGGAGGDCTFDKKSVAGGNLELAGTCKTPDGKSAKVAATGTLGASDQNTNLTVEGFDAAGAREGLMELQIHSFRNGECTAKDVRSPTATM